MAGKIDICCFDKTGTLTQNDLVIRGIAGLGNSPADRSKLNEIATVFSKDKNAALVLGGAHTLAFTEGALVGDPLEKQSFEGISFRQNALGARESYGPDNSGVKILQIKKFAFNSTLKRMSTLVSITESNGNSVRILSKGAPEVLVKYMKNVPEDYAAAYLKYVKNGARVLSLAYKQVPKMTQA